MSTFEFISVALSFILGLGVTRLLMSAVKLFLWRGELDFHWIPVAWATVIFLFQIQFWWAIFELSHMLETWTFLHFFALVGLALLLFVSGALVLPSSKPTKERSLLLSFDRDGRWSLAFLGCYFVVSYAANWYFWGVSPLSYLGGFMLLLVVGLIAYLFVPNRKVRSAITLAYLVLTIAAIHEFSPASY